MSGPLSNLFTADDGNGDGQEATVPVSSLFDDQGDGSGGSQHVESAGQTPDDGDAPAFAVSSDSGDPGAPSGDWLTSE